MEFTVKQESILKAAMEIISQNGLESLTTKELAKKLSLTEGALYRHFEGKNAILSGMMDYFEGRILSQIQLIEAEEISSWEKIENLFTIRINHFQQDPAMVTLLLTEELFLGDTGLNQKVRSILGTNFQTVQKWIEEAQKQNQVVTGIDPQYGAVLIIGGFRFLVTEWRLGGFKNQLQEGFKTLWKQINRIFLK